MKRKLALLMAGTMVLSTVSTSTIFAATATDVATKGEVNTAFTQAGAKSTFKVTLNNIEAVAGNTDGFVFTLGGTTFFDDASTAGDDAALSIKAAFDTAIASSSSVVVTMNADRTQATVNFTGDLTSRAAVAANTVGVDVTVPVDYTSLGYNSPVKPTLTVANTAGTVLVNEAIAAAGTVPSANYPATKLGAVLNSASGDKNQVILIEDKAGYNGSTTALKAGDLFKLELVNATWDNDGTIELPTAVAGTTSKLNVAPEYVMSNTNGANNRYQLPAETTAANQTIYEAQPNNVTNNTAIVEILSTVDDEFLMNIPYQITDPTQPVAIKVTGLNSTNPTLYNGFTLPLTAGYTANEGVKTTVKKATQNTLNETKKDGSVTFTGGTDEIKDGVYTLSLPSGYTFSNSEDTLNMLNNVAFTNASATVDFDGTSRDGRYELGLSDNRRSISFELIDYKSGSTVIDGSFMIKNLGVINSTGRYGTDVPVTISGSNSTDYDKTTGTIANFSTFKVNFTADTATKIQAGKQEKETYSYVDSNGKTQTTIDYSIIDNTQNTATMTITESIPNSFRGGDLVVTLPSEDFIVTGISDVSKVADSKTTLDYTTTHEVVDTNGKTHDVYDYITFTDNTVTFKNVVSASQGETFKIKFKLEIATDIDYEGDVPATLSAGPNSVDLITPVEVKTVADVNSVISVDTEVSEALVGYTNQPTADIVVTEEEFGMFENSDVYTFELNDNYNVTDDAYGFLQGYTVTPSSDDLDLITWYKNGVIFVEIDSNISKDPVSFTISDLEVYSNRSVPTYNGTNDVFVEVASDDTIQYHHTKDGYVRFVNEYTEGNEIVANNGYNKDVQITLGGNQATLSDGTKVDLYGTPYISADGNYMAPVKGFAYALGLEPEDIVFDNEAKIATFFLADGTVAQIQAGNKYATVNGQNIPLIDANGNIVTPVIKEGRFYLPLRATSKTIFGVEVDYNTADKSVVLNPSK